MVIHWIWVRTPFYVAPHAVGIRSPPNIGLIVSNSTNCDSTLTDRKADVFRFRQHLSSSPLAIVEYLMNFNEVK